MITDRAIEVVPAGAEGAHYDHSAGDVFRLERMEKGLG